MKEILTGALLNPAVIRGKSAYEIAVMHGFDGTEEEWLEFMAGEIAAKATQKAVDQADRSEEAADRSESAAKEAEQHTREHIHSWLDEHPEVTTSVEDHSLTIDKMAIGTLGYVTPQMYGAVGDGVADDTKAIQQAIDSGRKVFIPKGTYAISSPLAIYSSNFVIEGESINNTKIKKTTNTGLNVTITYGESTTDFNKDVLFAFVHPANSNVNNVHIKNIQLIGNSNSSYAIYAPHIAYCVFEKIRIQKCKTSGYFGGWINKIEDVHIFDPVDHAIRIMDGIAYVVNRFTSNGGAFRCEGTRGILLNGCSCDNGNPSYYFIDSKATLNGCTCETCKRAFAFDNSKVSINGGDFEGHTNENAVFQYFFSAINGSHVVYNGSYLHFADYYNLGYPNCYAFQTQSSVVKLTNCNYNIPFGITPSCSGTDYYLSYDNIVRTNIATEKNRKKISVRGATKTELCRLPIGYRNHLSAKLFGTVKTDYDTVGFVDCLVCAVYESGFYHAIKDNSFYVTQDGYSDPLSISCEYDTDSKKVVIYANSNSAYWNYDLELTY